MAKLIIISSSSRIRESPKEPTHAIERYDGVYFRILRTHLKKIKNVDVLILSEKLGLLWAQEKIAYHKPSPGIWGLLSLKPKEVEKERAANLEKLKTIMKSKVYDEVYVNVGKQYERLIEGYEKIIPCKITKASGESLGLKAQHMRNWLLSLRN